VKRFAARVGLPALSEDVKLTVIPLGGFTQRQRIEDAAWIFEKVLRAEIAIAALLDRDYRCNEEIDALVANMRVTVPRFHILPAKEIENYLLVPGPISCAAQERIRERATGKIEMDAVSDTGIESILVKCTDEVKADVSAQLIAHRSTFFNGRDSRDQATVVAETLRNLDSDWADVRRRLAIVPAIMPLTNRNLSNKECAVAVKSLAEAGAPDINESIITPEMIRVRGSVLTELQDAGCYQGYVLIEVYLAMRVLEPPRSPIKAMKSSDRCPSPIDAE
jgi:hypothetical protein